MPGNQRKHPREERAVIAQPHNSQGLCPPLSPAGESHSREKSHTFHTPTNSPHSSSISSLASKAAKSGGRVVFTTLYQRRDARLLKPFVRSDALCLPPEDYETAFNPRASSLTRPSRAGLCRQHSLIASAEAQRRQQLDFLLLIPWESREKPGESKPSAAGLVLKACFWPAMQGRWRLAPRAPSGAPWPGLSKGDSSPRNERTSVISLTSAAQLVPGREADLPSNQNGKIRTVLIARWGRGAHQLLSWPACYCPSSNFTPASRIYSDDFNRLLWPLRLLKVSRFYAPSFRLCLSLVCITVYLKIFLFSSFWNI